MSDVDRRVCLCYAGEMRILDDNRMIGSERELLQSFDALSVERLAFLFQRAYGFSIEVARGELKEEDENWFLYLQPSIERMWTLMCAKRPSGKLLLPAEVPEYVRKTYDIDEAGNVPSSFRFASDFRETPALRKYMEWSAKADNTMGIRCVAGPGITIMLRVRHVRVVNQHKIERAIKVSAAANWDELRFPFTVGDLLSLAQRMRSHLT